MIFTLYFSIKNAIVTFSLFSQLSLNEKRWETVPAITFIMQLKETGFFDV